MTTNMTSAVNDYAARIKAQIKTSATAWKAVAKLFAQAANEFGLQSDAMKKLLKKTGFSESKAVKLIAIANSDRLQQHEETFKCVDAWTVLYAITTLEDDEFGCLLDCINEDTVITQSIVNRAKNPPMREADNYKTAFVVQIDQFALKSRMFNEDDYNELFEAIETIQNTMNYVRVRETSRYENEVACFVSDVEKEMNKAIRKLFNEEKKNSTASALTKDQAAIAMSERDFEKAFAILNSNAFDREQQRSAAQKTVRNNREEKFINAANTYDACANTAIQKVA